MNQRRSKRPHGQVRQGQIVTTFGPGAMLDLPNHSVLVAGNPALAEPRQCRGLESLLTELHRIEG